MSRYEQVALGSLICEYSERNRTLACNDVYSVTNSEGFMASTDYFSKEVFSKDISTYKKVHRGMFAYNPSRVNVGSLAWLKDKETVVVSPMYVVFKIEESKLRQQFLEYYLRSDIGISQIRNLTSGSVRDSLKYTALERINMPLPPLDKQECIIEALDCISKIIKKRQVQLSLLDKLATDSFAHMFGDPISNPKGWEIETISNIASVRIGPFGTLLHAEDYIEDGIPLINPQHMVNGIIEPNPKYAISDVKYQEMASYHLAKNDIVLGRRGEIGRCAVVKQNHLPAICGTGSMIVRPDTKRVTPEYLHAVFYQPSFSRDLEDKATGSTMKNINATIVKDLKLPLPPIDLQIKYNDVTSKIGIQKLRLQTSLAELETTYNSTLQKAFNGELFQ